MAGLGMEEGVGGKGKGVRRRGFKSFAFLVMGCCSELFLVVR